MFDLTRRQFAHMGSVAVASGAALGMSRTAMAAASAAASTPYMDPELKAALQVFQQRMAQAQSASAAERVKAMADAGYMAQTSAGWAERTVPGAQGSPDVRVYVFNSTPGDKPRPAIVDMHGGGYTGGSSKMYLPALTPLGQALDCVIVSVEYRLAPATKFPGSLEDNYAALKWLYKNAAELGVDTKRIAVTGGSAGAGHAAMLAIAARDRGEVPIAYQALIYPMLDDRTGSSRKMPPYFGQIIWTPENNRAGWTALLGVPAGAPKVPYGSVPARLDDLRGLPPAFIGVGTLDLFVDESIAYARRLIDTGIPVELNVVPGAFHGFDFVAPEATVTKRFRASLIDALRRAFTLKA